MSNKKIKLNTLYISNDLKIGKEQRPILSYIDNLQSTIDEFQLHQSHPLLVNSVKNNDVVTLIFSQPIFAISLLDFHFYNANNEEVNPTLLRRISETEFEIDGCSTVSYITIPPTNRIVNNNGIALKSEIIQIS